MTNNTASRLSCKTIARDCDTRTAGTPALPAHLLMNPNPRAALGRSPLCFESHCGPKADIAPCSRNADIVERLKNELVTKPCDGTLERSFDSTKERSKKSFLTHLNREAA